MPRASVEGPGLSDWIDLLTRMRDDAGRPGAELAQRDRAIGERLTSLDGRPAHKLAAWVRALAAEPSSLSSGPASGPPSDSATEPAARSAGRTSEDAVRLAVGLLAVLGFVFGAAAAVGAFSFQPRGRINVVTVLGVLVALPNLFLLLALAHALPEAVRRRLPLVGAETGLGTWLQPARLALRTLPQATRAQLEPALGATGALAKLSAPLRRWLLLSASQTAALAFASGALATALAQVVFTDLSFGWSTTLDVDVDRIHRLATFFATPWAWLWPDASPSRALLESTRFFRIAPEPGSAVLLYGRWWPFIVMCLCCYTWLPRAVFLVVARQRFRAAIRRALTEAPGSRRVLARLESPLVESASPRAHGAQPTRSDEPPDGMGDQPTRTHEPPRAGGEASLLAEASLPERAVVIGWGDALALPEAAHVVALACARFEAGGMHTQEEDAEALDRAVFEAKEHGVPLLVAVRGYEPPLAEQIDFLKSLRHATGRAQSIVVAALDCDDARLGAWRRRLATLGDPWLSVARADPRARPVPGGAA